MDTKGFFTRLFDFSFKEFIILQIVKYLYIIGLIFAGTGVLDLRYDFMEGFFKILLTPVAFLLMSILFRLVLEALAATFRIAENTTKIFEH